MRNAPQMHAQDHRANSADPLPVLLHVTAFHDTETVVVGNAARKFTITDDLGGTFLRSAHGYVTTRSTSGSVTVQIRNVTQTDTDMLMVEVTIPALTDTSYDAPIPSRVDIRGTPPANYVLRSDMLAVDVDTAGTGAKGLVMLLEFGPQLILPTQPVPGLAGVVGSGSKVVV